MQLGANTHALRTLTHTHQHELVVHLLEGVEAGHKVPEVGWCRVDVVKPTTWPGRKLAAHTYALAGSPALSHSLKPDHGTHKSNGAGRGASTTVRTPHPYRTCTIVPYPGTQPRSDRPVPPTTKCTAAPTRSRVAFPAHTRTRTHWPMLLSLTNRTSSHLSCRRAERRVGPHAV